MLFLFTVLTVIRDRLDALGIDAPVYRARVM